MSHPQETREGGWSLLVFLEGPRVNSNDGRWLGVIINSGRQSLGRKVGRLNPGQALGEGQETIYLDSSAPTTAPSLSLPRICQHLKAMRTRTSIPDPKIIWGLVTRQTGGHSAVSCSSLDFPTLGTDGSFRERVHAILYGVGPRGPGSCLPYGQMGLRLTRQQTVKWDKNPFPCPPVETSS